MILFTFIAASILVLGYATLHRDRPGPRRHSPEVPDMKRLASINRGSASARTRRDLKQLLEGLSVKCEAEKKSLSESFEPVFLVKTRRGSAAVAAMRTGCTPVRTDRSESSAYVAGRFFISFRMLR